MSDLLERARHAEANPLRNGIGWLCCYCGELIGELANALEATQQQLAEAVTKCEDVENGVIVRVADLEQQLATSQSECNGYRKAYEAQTRDSAEVSKAIHAAGCRLVYAGSDLVLIRLEEGE